MSDGDDRADEGRFRALVWASASVVYRMSPDWRRMLQMDGVGFLADTTGPDESWLDRYIPAEDRPAVAAEIERAILAGSPFELEHRVVRADGSAGWTHSRAVPILDARGEVAEWLGAASDVTARKDGESALRSAEERLRVALAAARMGTWEWGIDGDAHRSDAKLNGLLGATAEEAVRPLAGFLEYVHPDDRPGVQAAFDESARVGRPLNIEFRVVHPDGTVRWLWDQGDVVDIAGSRQLAGVCIDVTDLKGAEQALRDDHDRLEARVAERTADLHAEIEHRKDLTRRLSSAQEDERQRVARDLHDSVGQLLAGLGLAFKAIELDAGPASPLAGGLARAEAIVDAIGKEVHGLAIRLRPTSLDDIGLQPALEQLVSEWSGRTGVRADFNAAGLGPDRLTPEIETTIYRVVQEALTNVGRHADAGVVSVIVTRPDGHVTAVVEDDGRGFDPGAVPAGRLGLVGIGERADLVDGTVEIESQPGSGTTLVMRIPMPEGGTGGA